MQPDAPTAQSRPASSGPVPAEFAPYLPPALADVNVPAYVLDAQGRIRWLNAAAVEVVGDVVGESLTDVVELDAPSAQRLFRRRLAGDQHGDHTVCVRGPGGESTQVEISSVPLTQEHRVIGMFGLAVQRDARATRPAHSPLTRRQHEVLAMLADGASTRGITTSLFLSEDTVRNHVRHILGRLGANSRLSAVAIARRNGFV